MSLDIVFLFFGFLFVLSKGSVVWRCCIWVLSLIWIFCYLFIALSSSLPLDMWVLVLLLCDLLWCSVRLCFFFLAFEFFLPIPVRLAPFSCGCICSSSSVDPVYFSVLAAYFGSFCLFLSCDFWSVFERLSCLRTFRLLSPVPPPVFLSRSGPPVCFFFPLFSRTLQLHLRLPFF